MDYSSSPTVSMLSQISLKLSNDFKRWGKAGKRDWQPEAKTRGKRVSFTFLEVHTKSDQYCLGLLASHLNFPQETIY